MRKGNIAILETDRTEHKNNNEKGVVACCHHITGGDQEGGLSEGGEAGVQGHDY